MNDYIITMGISIVLMLIKQAFKSEQAKAECKKALLKIRDNINLLYPGE
jgi:hypothetical protein